MNRKSGTGKAVADKLVKNIDRKPRQTYSAEGNTPGAGKSEPRRGEI